MLVDVSFLQQMAWRMDDHRPLGMEGWRFKFWCYESGDGVFVLQVLMRGSCVTTWWR